METPSPKQPEGSKAELFLRELGVEIEALRAALLEPSAAAAVAWRNGARTAERAGWPGLSGTLALVAERLASGEDDGEREGATALLDDLPALALRSHGAPRAATPLPGSGRPRGATPQPWVLLVPEPWAGLLPEGPGYTVHATRGPEEVVALTRRLRPDVVLLDASLSEPSLVGDARKGGPTPHAVAAIGDLTQTATLKAWLREGAHPIVSDQVRPLSLLGILHRAAGSALPAPAEFPHQQPVVLAGSAARPLFDAAPRMGPPGSRRRTVVVLCARGKRALWDLSLGMREVEVLCAHSPDEALQIAQQTGPDALLVAGSFESDLSALFATLFQDLLLSDIRIVQLPDAAHYESAAPGDPIFDELLRRIQAQLRCKIALESALRKTSCIEGRLEGITPATLLTLVAQERPNATVELRTPSASYRLRMSGGDPHTAAVCEEPSKPVLTGQAALRAILGLRSARLSIREAPPSKPHSGRLEGSLQQQLQQEGARCRGLQAVLSRAAWSGVQRVLVDLSPLARLQRQADPTLLAVAEQLRDGTPPALCHIPGNQRSLRRAEQALERALWKLCSIAAVTRVVPVAEVDSTEPLDLKLDPSDPAGASRPQPPPPGPGADEEQSPAHHTKSPPLEPASPKPPAPTADPVYSDRVTMPLGGAIVRSRIEAQPSPSAPPRPAHPTVSLGREMLEQMAAERRPDPPRATRAWHRWTVAAAIGGVALALLWAYRARVARTEIQYSLAPTTGQAEQPVLTPLLVSKPESLARGQYGLEPDEGMLEVVLPETSQLFVDGEFVGSGRIQRTRLGAGTHELRVVSPSHGTREASVTVEAGSRTRVSYAVQTGKQERP